MSLPENLEQEFWREVRQLEEETKMPYITSVERRGIEQGRQEGRQEGEARIVLLPPMPTAKLTGTEALNFSTKNCAK